ncbi:hypothetical protein GQX73_g6518 [Xylaria multiplex]|uniref:Heterokaryon incompatibility domain-containing protein n=1 Tax=Xylaria multiplex TaxID=323545 RepID=A0A7C8MW58_9PEZI|nr:hypothetical protein GQX73_g6518 [Xylaria multiplex]
MVLGLFQRFGLGARKDQYPGKPIRKPGTLIRVLKPKGIQGDRIDCKLKTIDITSRGDNTYDALSYRWGDIAHPRLIYCNGVPFKVQQSLFQALLEIWSKEPQLEIWVDAVCIDQNNPVELSDQVKIMGTIYQRARRVIIWLGEADEFTDLAWRTLLEASSPTQSTATNDLEVRLAETGDLEDIWLSIHNLGQREWFYRAWTFQELYLAQRATVLCSTYEMDWDKFHQALDRLATFLTRGATSTYSIKAKNTLQNLLGSVEQLRVSDTAFTLTDLLSRTIHRSCDEPKDKIYALLGVLFQKEGLEHLKLKYSFPVDYSSNPELVYMRVSRALAMRLAWTEPGRTKSQPLDLSILHGAGLDAHNRRYRTTWFKGLTVNRTPGDLPTWVTDWTDREASLSWAEKTYIKRDKWQPIISTDGLKLGAAVNLDESRGEHRELLLYGVVIARLVRANSGADDRIRFYLEELPLCVRHGSLLSQGLSRDGTEPYIRWTSEIPIEDKIRYPDDSPSHIYYSPRILRALLHHDQKKCECTQFPFFHTIIAAILALILSIIFGSAAKYLLILVFWVALKDARVMTGKPVRNFCLDIVATREHPTLASEGDWIVSLAGEQGLFLLKPTKIGKFKLVRGLLENRDMKPSCQVFRIDANGNKLDNWTSQYQRQGKGLSATPSWRDFRVLPISLSLI